MPRHRTSQASWTRLTLERQGWTLARIKGSHRIYDRPGAARPIPVPVHGSKSLKAGTQRSIMRAAGLTDGDL
jgi:predicted RNA binding protein YcfA (HicA-like mRNA interferase family)